MPVEADATLVAQRVSDGRVLRLIEAMLTADSYGEGQGVGCSPAIMPSLSKRWMVDGATPSTTAAFLIVSSSPSGAPGVGSKQGIPQCRRRLPTRPAVKR